MSQTHPKYEDWKATIESDPDLFLALAEETGLVDRLRERLKVRQQAPDFDAVAGKRMSELTPEQQEDARELWLRNQAGWFKDKDELDFLFKRLDQAREGAEPKHTTATPEANHQLGQVIRQRIHLANAILQSAKEAGIYSATDAKQQENLTISDLVALAEQTGKAAKATTGRAAMLDTLAVPGERFIPDWEAVEAIKRLDKTYYQRWRDHTLSGHDQQGYVTGNVPSGDLALIIEYTRRQLIEHGGMKVSEAPSNASTESTQQASPDTQPASVNDPGRTNAHGRNGLALIETMEALDKDEPPRVVALVDRESNEFSMIRVDPGEFETRILINEPGKRVHHYQMSQFAQLFWMTPADRFNAMDYPDWSKVAQFIRKATVAAQLGEPDITCTFADTPHLMAAHPTLSPDTARERLNLLERYPSASDTQAKLELTEILMAHRHGVAPDRSLFSQESLQSTPFAELVEMTDPEAIQAEVEEKYDIAHGFGAELEGDESRGYETSPVDMLRYDAMLQEVRELKGLQQAVHARQGSAVDVSDDISDEPEDFMRPG